MGIMRAFTNFLVEESTEEKLKHLEHPEDHIIKSSEPGFHHAFNTLKTTAEHLQGQDSGTRVMTKYDGAPSVVFGTNPENGKFFVASKSAFNKNPKLNYTIADIKANHGHAPGLVSKLTAALKYLPKVAPKHGVYQGDFLYNKADGDVTKTDKTLNFKPQLITYHAPLNSKLGRTIEGSKMGFAVHTAYKGRNLTDMKADYTPDLRSFAQHPDVHLHTWDQSFSAKKAALTPEEHTAFKTHMNAAGDLFKNADRTGIFHHSPEMQDHLSTYINSTVRNNNQPTVAGLASHVQARHQKGIDAVKTTRTKDAKTQVMNSELKHIRGNRENLDTMLKMHDHLQQAKNSIMPALTRGDSSGYKYSINGKQTGPEGFVTVTRDNRPTKLIDRAGFSRANLNKSGFGK